jgi:putative SOS response-associated peptidase YedK
MCGRYSFVTTPQRLGNQLKGIILPPDLSFSYHIAPTHRAWVVTSEVPYTLQAMQWGLVMPHKTQSVAPMRRHINARAEGLWVKPAFRDAAAHRRCLIPADSFYEWKKVPHRKPLPFRILPPDGSLLFMAGIWSELRQGSEVLRTFAIVTVPAGEDLAALHHRMPALLLTEEEQRLWITPSPVEDLVRVLKPTPPGLLTWYPVSERLNKPGFDHPSLHEPATPLPTLF